ncbi:MAG TPA: DUF1553 domain-containing protein [Gemmataceae bacterium]|nr:DUF1553 domain-containing protein [Gemmataceae bacterium]
MTGPLLLTAVLVGAPPPPHFDTEVVPVLTRAGCNAGACHGAAAGRGGFHLSLFGSDPAADHEAIVHALEGRRVNPARPAESLVLGKPAGRVKHGGGKPLPAGSPGAELLTRWIEAGAPRGAVRKLTHFAVTVGRRLVEDDRPVTLRAVARFDGGPDIDVTRWTVFAAADPTALELDETAMTVAVRRRGQHVLTARFLDRVEPVRVTRPVGDQPSDLSGEPTANLIDEEVVRTLAVLRLPASPPADDLAFLRRVRLDLTGTLPSPDEMEAFRKEPSRPALVERLLISDEFVDYWTLRFARTLRAHSVGGERETIAAYTGFLKQALRDGVPFDRWARAVLTATGDSHSIGPANFARTAADARGQAELVGRVFLGVRIQCANCHNHPLDRWTQDDYHGLAAVFAKLDRGRTVKIAPFGSVTNPRTGEPAVPRIPGAGPLTPADPIAGFTDWLTATDNPYFAKAMVNRLWRAMFGRGLVEPVDDLRATNPATHPELLDRLAADFVHHRYDVRHTLRTIALSRAYGRSPTPVAGNESDDRYYARSYRRQLDPEVLADAIVSVTGVAQTYAGHPAGARAITIYDPLSPAPDLDVLGRCSRATACDEAAVGGGLPAKLHLLNGNLLNAKVANKDGRLGQLIVSGMSDREIVAEFYIRGFGRPPTDRELTDWATRLGKGERRLVLEDFLWGLLNSREFGTNH